MDNEYKGFYKKVGGNEGSKCRYATRLDTYGKGCSHNCLYCHSRSLLDFRGLWNPERPAVADIDKIRRKVRNLDPSMPAIRMGGMTDCFQPIEREFHVTYETIRALNERGVQYLIVTKSPLVATPEYLSILDPELAHVQVSVTSTDDSKSKLFERAPVPSKRIEAIETLQRAGIDVALRLSPYIPEFIDVDVINAVKVDKLLVEFLWVNTWVRRWFDIDFTSYMNKQGGYRHLTLELKCEYLEPLRGHHELSVCEDVDGHYRYWRDNVNPNPEDCCNLRV